MTCGVLRWRSVGILDCMNGLGNGGILLSCDWRSPWRFYDGVVSRWCSLSLACIWPRAGKPIFWDIHTNVLQRPDRKSVV